MVSRYNPWTAAIAEAGELLRMGRSPEQVQRTTRLPKSVVDQIAEPILKEMAEQAAIREAEKALERERKRVLMERYPCQLCHKGYGVVTGGPMVGFMGGGIVYRVDGNGKDDSSVFFRPYYAHCSRKHCPAQLIFPRDSEQEALDAFVLGEWVKVHPFHSLEDGSEWLFTKRGLERSVTQLLAEYSSEQVKQLGFNPAAVDELANMLALQRIQYRPDLAFDTTLMCPNCGSKGEYRKAVNPLNHKKNRLPCWWRVGCPECGTRTVHSFPYQDDARLAFEENDLERKPKLD